MIATDSKVDIVSFYVNGAWETPRGRTMGTVTNPATGAVLAEVPYANAADVDTAVRTAHADRTGPKRGCVAKHLAITLGPKNAHHLPLTPSEREGRPERENRAKATVCTAKRRQGIAEEVCIPGPSVNTLPSCGFSGLFFHGDSSPSYPGRPVALATPLPRMREGCMQPTFWRTWPRYMAFCWSL